MLLLLLRTVLIVLLVQAVWRLVGGIVEGSAGAASRLPRERPPVPLERDPICGTYVVRSRAVTLAGRDGVKYFCSEQCRRAYADRRAAG